MESAARVVSVDDRDHGENTTSNNASTYACVNDEEGHNQSVPAPSLHATPSGNISRRCSVFPATSVVGETTIATESSSRERDGGSCLAGSLPSSSSSPLAAAESVAISASEDAVITKGRVTVKGRGRWLDAFPSSS